MSSYGAWDGGPPGAEGEYGEPPIPGAGPPVAVAPATDPWTGRPLERAPYAAHLDYYGYQYPAHYTQHYPPDAYAHYAPPPPPPAPPAARERPPSPPRRRRTRSRSPEYTRRARRERSASRSYSRSPPRRALRSSSSDSSASERSYKRKSSRSSPSPRRRSPEPEPRYDSERPASSRAPEPKYHSSREPRGAERRREATPPPRKWRDSVTPPLKSRRERDTERKERPSVTPPRSYARDRDRSQTPPKSYKYKSDTPPRKARDSSITPPRKARDSSITPPKSYARGGSVSSDKSDKSSSKSSKSSPPPTPPRRKKRERRSPASSEGDSSDSSRARSKAKRKEKKRRSKSRSKSRSKRRSRSMSKSKSRRRSRSKDDRKKRSVSPGSPLPKEAAARSRSRSSGGTPSDNEQRRGQFTVADRKRFWKMHKTRQEKDPKTPPKEVKPPPGAVENTTVDDLEYGDPPEVEGPNFAELLSPPDMLLAQASSSKSKTVVPVIKNDGSFLEMFKKMQEATKKAEESVKKPEIKKPTLPFIGKRRGGRVLKTGMVKKAKAIDEQTVDNAPKDAWSLYMQEVKKYRETSCEEERKTRPLVK